MKITITRLRSEQVSYEAWSTWTDVIHISESDTIADIVAKNKSRLGFHLGVANVELHIEIDAAEGGE